MTIQEICKRLGYPKHSDVVYTLLQENDDPLLVSDVATQAKLSRMAVYRALEVLVRDSLIATQQIGKRTYYVAGSAELLAQRMQMTQSATEEVVARALKRREKETPQNTRFLYGKAGIRAAFDDVVIHAKKGETFFRYTSEKDLDTVNSYLARDYRERRDAKKLERKVISNPRSGTKKQSRLERFIRYIPAEADQFEQNIIQLVYGDRVSIIDLNKEEVVIIENAQLADFQKTIFTLLYNQLPRI